MALNANKCEYVTQNPSLMLQLMDEVLAAEQEFKALGVMVRFDE